MEHTNVMEKSQGTNNQFFFLAWKQTIQKHSTDKYYFSVS